MYEEGLLRRIGCDPLEQAPAGRAAKEVHGMAGESGRGETGDPGVPVHRVVGAAGREEPCGHKHLGKGERSAMCAVQWRE